MLTGRLKSILTITTIALFLPDRLVAGENNALLDVLKNSENRAKSIVNKHRISYSLLTNANPLNPKQGLVLKQCIASWQDDTLSMNIVYSYEKPPVYSSTEQSIDYDKDGALIIWRAVEKYVQFSPTRNEVLKKSKRFYAYPDGSLKEGNETTFHLIYPIGKQDSITEYSHFELATGRGISKQLKNISSIERNVFGTKIKMIAKGILGKGFEGWWALSVDPNSDHLVREATFSADANSLPVCKITSSGAILLKGSVAFASKGSLLFDNRLETTIDNVEIIDMSDEDCAVFHQNINNLLDMPMTPGSQVWDFRGKKPIKSTVK